MKSLGMILMLVGLVIAVVLGVGKESTPSVQAAQTAVSVKYDTSVIRIGQPFSFRSRGTSAGFWQLRNIDSGDYTFSVSTKKGYVVVTLTVHRVNAGEIDEASPLVSWVDPTGKSVDIPLTILPKDSPIPSGASVMKIRTINGEKIYTPYFTVTGNWGRNPPLIYIPVGRGNK